MWTKHLAAALLVAGMGGVAQGAVIANWTFEVSDPPSTTGATNGPHAPEAGSGSATGFHANTAGGWSSPAGNGSNNAWNGNNWTQGDYFQFEVSTVGLEDVTLSWDQTRSSSGPATWDLQYATSASGPLTTLSDNYDLPVVTWSTATAGGTTFSADLSSVTSVDNSPVVVFRIVADSSPTSATGSSRLDNVIVSGTPIPEPAAGMLLGLGLLLGHRRRRRLRFDGAKDPEGLRLGSPSAQAAQRQVRWLGTM